MLDIKEIRSNPKQILDLLQRKMPEADFSSILSMDEKIRSLKTSAEELKAKRNSVSKEIGEKKRQGHDVTKTMQEVADMGDKIAALDQEWKSLELQMEHLLAMLPNLPFEDIPNSPHAKDNVCIKEVGQKRRFSFVFKNHVELNEKLHLFDFKRGAKVSGSGWPVYTNLGARIEWALINFMLDTHRKNGFKMIMPPLLARPEIIYGSGQLPKFENQLFKIKDDDYHLYLIPTSEVALNGLHYQETLDDSQLPIRYTAYTPCFRREAGAAGSNERGLIRMHQFNKVELFCLTKPEESGKIFEEMLKSAEEILQGLNLHYRNMLLTTGDMSFAAAKTIDIEVWLPGQDRYYEVSSVSNCTDFQSRRAQIRYKEKKDGKIGFVHTLNGSGLATSRLMVALLENNQREDGSVEIPKVLQPYLEEEILEIKP
jgi:seryl-tRNA synthetase